MPAVIYPAFEQLLLDLFLSKVAAPTTLYLGLAAGTTEIGATDGNGHASGYVRQAVAVSGLSDGAGGGGYQLTFPTAAFPAFTAVPNPNGATNWFISSALTGGTLYFSGPLNPAVVTGNLTVAIASGSLQITLPSAISSQFMVGDILALGSTCAGDLEYAGIVSLGTVSGGNQTAQVSVPPGSQGFAHAHPVGEAYSRDGATRIYTVGFVETVSAALQLLQG
ncbi:MAG: phage tail fiber protein [Janthinobacterium lividum]